MAERNENFWCNAKRRVCSLTTLPCPDCPRKDRRRSSARRGYGAAWRKVREAVLAKYGIPRDEWPKYDVDHNPPYDPDAEPDHRKYTLIPRLHSDHASKTAREDTRRDADGRFRGGRHRGGYNPLRNKRLDRG